MSTAPNMPLSREARFNVNAPAGGFQRRINSLITGVVKHLTLEIEDNQGHTSRLRITPFDGEITMDPKRSSVYNINKAMAVYVDEDGNELLHHPPVNVSLYLNTEVQALGMPAGVLNMWSL